MWDLRSLTRGTCEPVLCAVEVWTPWEVYISPLYWKFSYSHL